MNHPQRKPKRHKGNLEPTTLTVRDKLQICGIVAIIVIATIGIFFIRIRTVQRIFSETLTRKLDRWRSAYHLEAAQVNRIRDIEIAFHGNGNFLTKPAHTVEETFNHHREIAAVMEPEDGKRFLKDQRKH